MAQTNKFLVEKIIIIFNNLQCVTPCFSKNIFLFPVNFDSKYLFLFIRILFAGNFIIGHRALIIESYLCSICACVCLCICVIGSVICSIDPDNEWFTTKLLVMIETGAKHKSKTFILKNTTDKEKISFPFFYFIII